MLDRSPSANRGLDFDQQHLAAVGPAVSLRFDQIMGRAGPAKVFLWKMLLFVAAAAELTVYLNRPEYGVACGIILLPTLILLSAWNSHSENRLPIFPMFILQQAILLALPLVVGADATNRYSATVTQTSAIIYAGFCFSLLIGFQFGISISRGKPSRYPFDLPAGEGGAARLLKIGLLILSIACLSKVLTFTGLIWNVFHGSWGSAYPLYRTVESAATLGGCFLAAYAIGAGARSTTRSNIFWLLVAFDILLGMSGLLMSAAMMTSASVAFGLTAGSRRIPWKFLIILSLFVCLLQEGKSEMRYLYRGLSPKKALPHEPVAKLLSLPSFYMEWISLSMHNILAPELQVTARGQNSQMLVNRLDNLANLNSVTQQLLLGKPVFGVASYTMIPKLTIPRFLWPNKPRTHITQVLFNLHFERQRNMKETERTYISIGLLAECVGSLGMVRGPLFVGLAIGFLIGWLERIAQYKQILSIDGMMVLVVVLGIALSFEMTAAVLVAALFQQVTAVFGGCLLLAGRAKPQPSVSIRPA